MINQAVCINAHDDELKLWRFLKGDPLLVINEKAKEQKAKGHEIEVRVRNYTGY